MSPHQPTIVIKKKKRGHHGHHGGAWKVAYADFVTAMMAFFLVLWLVGQSKAVKAAVAGYFREPGIFDQPRSDGPIPGGTVKLDPESTTPEAAKTLIEDEKASLEKAARRIRKLLMEAPDLERLAKQIEISVTRDGLRIELLDGEQQTFFASGSSSLAAGTERVLSLIARELGRLKNSVVIEGHTDSRPYAAKDLYSNWELSADRANAARRIMERNGLSPAQVRGVRGYADRHLRFDNAPLDPRNRRVSVIVEHMWRTDSLPEAVRNLAGSPSGSHEEGGNESGPGAAGSASPEPARPH